MYVVKTFSFFSLFSPSKCRRRVKSSLPHGHLLKHRFTIRIERVAEPRRDECEPHLRSGVWDAWQPVVHVGVFFPAALKLGLVVVCVERSESALLVRGLQLGEHDALVHLVDTRDLPPKREHGRKT